MTTKMKLMKMKMSKTPKKLLILRQVPGEISLVINKIRI